MSNSKISDTEWLVMKVLWSKSPLTANEVIEALEESTNWKPKTVKTLLSRLVTKNVISYKKDSDRSYLYYPLLSEEMCVQIESDSFLDRIFDGALNHMLASFVERKKLSSNEIDELKKILDTMKGDKGENND